MQFQKDPRVLLFFLAFLDASCFIQVMGGLVKFSFLSKIEFIFFYYEAFKKEKARAKMTFSFPFHGHS